MAPTLKVLLASGFSIDGQAFDLWQYPDDWVVEMYSGEGPKLLRRGRYFYLIAAVGGTSGPPTGHMVVVSRSESIHGPWEQCPHNPIVRTTDARQRWWSRGHASLVEGPGGRWWMVYHGYENGYYNLGRQTLLDPVEWTEDGWFRALGGDLSQPIPKPSFFRQEYQGTCEREGWRKTAPRSGTCPGATTSSTVWRRYRRARPYRDCCLCAADAGQSHRGSHSSPGLGRRRSVGETWVVPRPRRVRLSRPPARSRAGPRPAGHLGQETAPTPS